MHIGETAPISHSLSSKSTRPELILDLLMECTLFVLGVDDLLYSLDPKLRWLLKSKREPKRCNRGPNRIDSAGIQ